MYLLTLNKPSKNYTYFVLRHFGLFLSIFSHKIKQHLAKMSKAKPRPPTMSKSLKAGPTAMQKMLKQNLRKVKIYKIKPRPARG